MTNSSEYRRRESADRDGPSLPTSASPLQNAATILETEVLPRLLMMHRTGQGVEMYDTLEGGGPRSEVRQKDVEEFAGFLIGNDVDGASKVVSRVRAVGYDDEGCLLHLFAPAARYLGECWEKDEASFTDVTIGLGCLQLMMRRDFGDPEPKNISPLPFRARLLAAPGEQHTLGILLIERAYRERGWQTNGGQCASWAALRREVSQTHFDALGISVSTTRVVGQLEGQIKRLRTAALNPDLIVIIGGSALEGDDFDSDAARFGADVISSAELDVIQATERLIGYHDFQSLPV